MEKVRSIRPAKVAGLAAALVLGGCKPGAVAPAAEAAAPPPPPPPTNSERWLNVASASDETFVAIAAERRDLLLALRDENPSGCADYYYGDFPPSAPSPMSSKSRQLFDEHLSLLERAAAEGRDHPVKRPPFSDRLNDELEQALVKAGASHRDLELWRGEPPKSVDEACWTGILIYRGAAALPRETAGGWMSRVVERAVAQRKSVEEGLRDDPSSSALMAATREMSPPLYERMVDGYVLTRNAGPGVGADRLRGVFADIKSEAGAALAHASDDAVLEFARKQLAAAAILQPNDAACADFVLAGGQARAGGFPPSADEPVLTAFVTLIRAAVDARTARKTRVPPLASEQAVYDAALLRAGAPDWLIARARSPSFYARGSDRDRCSMAIAEYRAVLSLSPDKGAVRMIDLQNRLQQARAEPDRRDHSPGL